MATMVTMNVAATVDVEVRRRATEILGRAGLTVEQAVEQMLNRTAHDGELPFASEHSGSISAPGVDLAYDTWFCMKAQEALDDPRPLVSNEEAQRRWAEQKAGLIARAEVAKLCA